MKAHQKTGFLLHLETPWGSIVHFNVSQLGLDSQSFIAQISSSFADLAPDLYDYRRSHLEFLRSKLTNSQLSERLDNIFVDYYRGNKSIEELNFILNQLENNDLEYFKTIRPLRKRAICRFELEILSESIAINHAPMGAFKQYFLYQDYRSIERNITPSRPEFIQNPLLHQFLKSMVTQLLLPWHPAVSKIEIIVHQMQVFTSPGHIATNAPEGMHQDGADYIVSALVIEKHQVSGAESSIYAPDKIQELYRTTLGVGEGIFMRDLTTKGNAMIAENKDHALWHDVTPIKAIDSNQLGWRSILGLDINITQ